MALQYSCFISYRRLDGDMEIVKDLCDAISAEISRLISRAPVYRDENRLAGGDLIDTQLASALCKSTCMIVFYVPVYFDEIDTYCAREYRAMEALEKRRLERLRQSYGDDAGGHGLIIPIIFRGKDLLPAEFKQRRKAYVFDYVTSPGDIRTHPKCLEEVKQIADYVWKRSLELGELPDVGTECTDFQLPPDGDDLKAWVRSITAPLRRIPFPLREAGR